MIKIGERMWEVDYDFFYKKDGRKSCMRIQSGFETETEAKRWAAENTTDGEVHWYERIW